MFRIIRRIWPLWIGGIALLFSSCAPQEPQGFNYGAINTTLAEQIVTASQATRLADLQFPEEGALDAIPQDPLNPLTSEKVALGKLLYHETGLGRDPKHPQGMLTYGCASCHHVAAGFQANRRQGIGDGGVGFGYAGEDRRRHTAYKAKELDVQPIRTPSALNVAYQRVMLWNGQFGATGPNAGTESQWTPGTPIATNELGFEGVETQAIAGLGVHRMVVDSAIIALLGCLDKFDAAFADVPSDQRYTLETAGLAIAAYERTLLAREAPFQRWLRGEIRAMTYQQKLGAELFFGEAGCVACHDGPALNSESFHALGMNDLMGPDIFNSRSNSPSHLGRGGFTGNDEERYQFKVPQLYNLKDSPFLGHGGNFLSVRDIIHYKNVAVSQNPRVDTSYLDPAFKPLNLTEDEVTALVDFVENALYDPNLGRFVPETLPSGNCFPNADPFSQEDLGCE